jgi:tRNA (adenine57-N1/adenine58-N1)-methyltransferase
VFLDLPEPWKAVENVSKYLAKGGMLISYSPNVGQVQETVKELVKHGYVDISTIEILERGWIIDEKRARPKDRMVAHTGFITIAIKIGKERFP